MSSIFNSSFQISPKNRVDFSRYLALGSIASILALSSCAPWSSTDHKVETHQLSNENAEDHSDFVRYTDEIGRQVELPRCPNRIISLAPSVTEILYMLGVQDRLIGVTKNSDWPESVHQKPKIGDLLAPNYELILASNPDLVIATTAGNDRAAILKLADLGLRVYVTAPRSVEKIFETVVDIGRITNRPSEGRQLVASMKSRLEDVRRRLEGLPATRAFFMTWFDPLLAPGKKTFESDVLRRAGVESITSDLDDFYPRYSLEQIISRDPDVIIAVDHNAPYIANLKDIAGWRELSAVRKGNVFVVGEVIQHPSPRFVDGVEELARSLHPERFQ